MACLIEPKAIKVRCPYCTKAPFWVKGPGKCIKDKEIVGSSPREVECLPYARDIGRFDNGEWTKIGSDFHSTILGWERIGILRTVPKQKICYRVIPCPQCKHLFEVYTNYTPKMLFAEMWPHLFEKSQGDGIKQYEGITLTQKIIDNNSLTLWFVSFLLLISFIPDIVWQSAFNWTELLMRGISCLSLWCILRISFSFRPVSGP